MSLIARAWRVGMGLAVAAVVASGVEPAVAAVRLSASSATVASPGDDAELCVFLDSGGAEVAGTQNDLVWDGSCATLSTPQDCRVDPTTDKQLNGAFPPQFDFTYRALVLSLTDVNPIRDGRLYCCAFIVEAERGECCPVSLTRGQASDPQGSALPVFLTNAQLCVSGGSGPTPPPTATPIPASEDDGCQIASKALTAWLPISLALAALVALRRRGADRAAVSDRSVRGEP